MTRIKKGSLEDFCDVNEVRRTFPLTGRNLCVMCGDKVRWEFMWVFRTQDILFHPFRSRGQDHACFACCPDKQTLRHKWEYRQGLVDLNHKGQLPPEKWPELHGVGIRPPRPPKPPKAPPPPPTRNVRGDI